MNAACTRSLPTDPHAAPNKNNSHSEPTTAQSSSISQPKSDSQARAFAARKQWDAKLLSFRRGMEHVQQCHAGSACGSSLCHSTKRLMHTYTSHQCASSSVECKVCKLWEFLVAKTMSPPVLQRQRAVIMNDEAGLSSRVASPSIIRNCRVSSSALSRRSHAFLRITSARDGAGLRRI